MREKANEVDGRVYLTGGLTSNIAVDFAGLIRKNDGYIADIARNVTVGDQRVIDLRSKIMFQPSDAAKIVLSVERFDQNSATNANTPLDGNTAGAAFPGAIIARRPWTVSLTKEPVLNIDRLNVALRTQFKFDEFNLETTTGYQDAKMYQDTDSDSSNIFLGDFPAKFFSESISQEVKLASTSNGPFQWLVGGYFFQFGGHTDFAIVTNRPGVSTTSAAFRPELEARSFAGYGEATYEVVPSFFLTAGGRYTTEKRNFEQVLNGRNLFGRVDRTLNKFNYRLAARLNVTDRTNLYASYGTAFKSGVYNMAGTLPTPVNPEEIKAVEFGIKSDPLRWLRTNLSVYHYKYNDLQVQAKDANGVSYVLQNAANAKIYGGELEITISPTRDFNLRASSAYTHARYEDFPLAQSFTPIRLPNGQLAGNTVAALDASGKTMTRAPKWTFNLGADYGMDLGSGRLGFAGNVYYSSKVYYDFQNIFAQDKYALINASVSWSTSDSWKFSIWTTNLTNKAVYQTIRPGALGTDGFFEQPRRIGFGIETKF